MASQRLSPNSARQVHRVYDAQGAFLSGHANKSAASRWVNAQTKAGIDTTGWTIRPYTAAQEK